MSFRLYPTQIAQMEGDKLSYASEIQRFLTDIHGSNSVTLLRAIWGSAPKNQKRGRTRKSYFIYSNSIESDFKWIYQYNSISKYEIFFSINPHTYSKKLPPRCFVIDMDLGSNDEGVFKSSLDTATETCTKNHIPFTHMVRTRNGFHLYWTISEDIPCELWIAVQKHLILLFNSDKTIKSPSQLMRLPFTKHWKGNEYSSLTTVDFTGEQPYKLEHFTRAIGILDLEKTEEEESKRLLADMFSPKDGSSALISESVLKPSNKKPAFKPFRNRRGIPSALADKRNSERYKKFGKLFASTKSDLSLLLKYIDFTPKNISSFPCPFHDDHNPSAGIFLKDGNYVFQCFSDKCGITGDIITLIIKREGLKGPDLLNRVKEINGIERKEKSLNFKDYLNGNLKFFNLGVDGFISSSIYTKADKTLIQYLLDFTEFAKTKMKNEDRKFSASLPEIQKAFGIKQVHNSSKKLYFLVFMGLVERIQETEIPETQVLKRTEYKESKGHKNPISWWIIPEYNEELIKSAFEKLKELRNAKINLENFNRTVLRNAFGEEEVKRVFVGDSDFNPNKYVKKSVSPSVKEDKGTEANSTEQPLQIEVDKEEAPVSPLKGFIPWAEYRLRQMGLGREHLPDHSKILLKNSVAYQLTMEFEHAVAAAVLKEKGLDVWKSPAYDLSRVA